MNNPYLPYEAEVVNRIQESESIFTLNLRLTDRSQHQQYRFAPGQFNMLYAYGAGEVAISIASDPEQRETFGHTIRIAGRVTRVLAQLKSGDRMALRGPYGKGWPLEQAHGRDLVLVTGGLGCAPVVAVINYALNRRNQFRRLVIMQGVKHAEDLIWRERYQAWAGLPDTQVLLAADEAGDRWPWHVGKVTVLFDKAQFDPQNCAVMMCGPEPMMIASAKALVEHGVSDQEIWISMERNHHCGFGHCGHCQFGPYFVCQDGPVFRYGDIKWLLGTRGF